MALRVSVAGSPVSDLVRPARWSTTQGEDRGRDGGRLHQGGDPGRNVFGSTPSVAASDGRHHDDGRLRGYLFGTILEARQKKSWRDDSYILTQIAAFILPNGRRFGDKLIGAVTEDDVEACLQSLKDRGRAASTRNKYLQTFKAMSRWGQRKGYLSRPWIGSFTDLKREKHARRSRRLRPDEEAQLLTTAAPRLYQLIVAALETGCRLGELLSLLWQDVDLTGREMIIRAVNAKGKKHRHIPISRRLLAVLEMAQHDPAGHRFGPEAFVFGDEIGQRVSSPKKAWETAVLKAHGHTPEWVKGSNTLAPGSRSGYREIDLRFHDLRHEAGVGGWRLECLFTT